MSHDLNIWFTCIWVTCIWKIRTISLCSFSVPCLHMKCSCWRTIHIPEPLLRESRRCHRQYFSKVGSRVISHSKLGDVCSFSVTHQVCHCKNLRAQARCRNEFNLKVHGIGRISRFAIISHDSPHVCRHRKHVQNGLVWFKRQNIIELKCTRGVRNWLHADHKVCKSHVSQVFMHILCAGSRDLSHEPGIVCVGSRDMSHELCMWITNYVYASCISSMCVHSLCVGSWEMSHELGMWVTNYVYESCTSQVFMQSVCAGSTDMTHKIPHMWMRHATHVNGCLYMARHRCCTPHTV